MTLIGISWPFRKQDGEFPARDTDAEAVRSNLLALFNCDLRSRVMRPDLGTDATLYVFESIDPLLIARLQRSIRQTIATGEPRATVSNIEFSQEGTKLVALITYVVNGIEESIVVDVATQV